LRAKLLDRVRLANIAYPNADVAAAIDLYALRCRQPGRFRLVGITKGGTAHLFLFTVVRFAIWGSTSQSQTLYHTPYPMVPLEVSTMSHTKSEKDKLLNRVKRVRGQIEAVERALHEEKGCSTVLHLIVAARGGLSSLMTEVIEDHIRLHVVDPTRDAERSRGAEELIEVVQAYLK
jgi:DNA-binding FrmR family transcriptional regulator